MATWKMRAVVVLLLLLLAACRTAPAPAPVRSAEEGLPESTPTHEGLDAQPLLKLVDNISRAPDAPLYSLLISRHGKLVLELYTSSFTRDHAHYVMSVTKSFTSATVGAMIDRGALAGADRPLDEML